MNVSVLCLLYDALKAIIGNRWSSCLSTCQRRSGNDTVGYFYLGKFYGFIFDFGIKTHKKFRSQHVGLIGKAETHVEVSATVIRNFNGVSRNVFSLVSLSRSVGFFGSGIFQYRSNFYGCVFVEPFFGESSVNGYRHTVANSFQGRWGCVEV